MKLKLDPVLPAFNFKLNYEDELLFLGSCFSDEIGKKFSNAGFKVTSNPFGTIFHPIALARLITSSLEEQTEINAFQTQQHWKSFDTSSIFQSSTLEDLETQVLAKKQEFKGKIKQANYFFITLGTSWGYRLVSNGLLVANCHKEKASSFTKELSSLDSLIETWKHCIDLILKENPSIQLIFTVSPVRHSKDGLIENNRSKARLFELISNLESSHGIHYFPSYEIVIDELRDYRFYTEDLVHPNSLAINYIWEIISSSLLSAKAQKIAIEVEKLRLFAQHKIQTPIEEEKLIFESNRNLKIKQFLEKYPFVRW